MPKTTDHIFVGSDLVPTGDRCGGRGPSISLIPVPEYLKVLAQFEREHADCVAVSKPAVQVFTPEQVVALNEYQRAGRFHPFTCGNDRTDAAHVAYQAEHGGDFGQLLATEYGWICPVPNCGYTQDWAHGFMLSGETLKLFPAAREEAGGE